MNTSSNKIPTSFWIIAVMALMWNIMGVMSFIGQTFMGHETLPEDQRSLYESVPIWLTIVFAVATITGTLGSIGLIRKKSWATIFLFISLIAVLIQMSYNLFLTNAAEILGPTATIMSGVLGVLVFLF